MRILAPLVVQTQRRQPVGSVERLSADFLRCLQLMRCALPMAPGLPTRLAAGALLDAACVSYPPKNWPGITVVIGGLLFSSSVSGCPSGPTRKSPLPPSLEAPTRNITKFSSPVAWK